MSYITGKSESVFHIDLSYLKKYSFEIGNIRPPSEGGVSSLLLRITRNCPWGRCAFCYAMIYNREQFEIRSVKEVKKDIDNVKNISEELKALSWKLGYAGRVEPMGLILQSSLRKDRDVDKVTADEMNHLYCLITVFNWICTGGKTVFLQDADTPAMRTDQLVEILEYLKEVFPDIERITSYNRAKTIFRKKPEELSRLNKAGLNRLHVGLETGDEDLLSYIDKGVTVEEHIIAGKKVKEAGFELSEYIIPGLGGRKLWVQHAENTARVLNEIDPHFIRSRPLVPRANTPIMEAYRSGEFELTTPHERLMEIGLLVKNLNVTSRVCFDHQLNPMYWKGNKLIPLLKQDYDGYKFPEEKQLVLETINNGLQMDEVIFVYAKDMIELPYI